MGRTERRVLVAGSIVLLLASSAVTGVAAPVASGGPVELSSTLSGSPAAFAERITASHGQGAGGRSTGSLRTAIELIVLATACAIVVAFYSSTAAPSNGTRVPAPIRRR